MNVRKTKAAGFKFTIMLAAISLLGAGLGFAAAPKKPKKPPTPVYITLDEAREKDGPGIDLQGEYEGEVAGGGKLGVQAIALGKGAFQAVVLPGGLPGAGWDGKTKIILDGKLEGGKIVLAAPEDSGRKKYLAENPADFSAVREPAAATKKYTATIADGKITGKTDDGKAFAAKRVVRESPTLGAKPPEGATVLFDGSNIDAWNVTDAKHFDAAKKELYTLGSSIKTNQKFADFTMHLEFRLPYRPEARGQGRGNSGYYLVDQYEVQVLDSFGLDGLHNECGGIYKMAQPKVNMCLPPLTWQTYDVEFQNAKLDSAGKKIKNAIVTLKHNGVVIHDQVEIDGKTGGARKDPEGTPGQIQLQGHGNPLAYRNIWIVEK